MKTLTVDAKAKVREVKIVQCETNPNRVERKAARVGATGHDLGEPSIKLDKWFWCYDYGIGEGFLRTVASRTFSSRAEVEADLKKSQHAEMSVMALDVGFSVLVQKMTVNVPACINLTVHTDAGTLVGSLPDVIVAMRHMGYRVHHDVCGTP